MSIHKEIIETLKKVANEIPLTYKGKLFVFEGIDGAGKSSQVEFLKDYLSKMGYDVIVTRWNSAKNIAETIKKIKKEKDLKPLTSALLHATDLAERLTKTIIPALKEGKIIICDRYYYTSLARDTVRGVNSDWLKKLFSFTIEPTCVIYLKIDPRIAVKRIIKRNKEKLSLSDTYNIMDYQEKYNPKYYETGMDLNLSDDPIESFFKFQSLVSNVYDNLSKEYNFIIINANQDPQIVHSEIIKNIQKHLENFPIKEPIKYVKGLPIVIENPKGTIRKFKDSGNKIMACDYGYIKNTVSSDNMELDVFYNENGQTDIVYEVSKWKKDGKYSEPKFFIGFSSPEEVKEIFLLYYPEEKLGDIKSLTWDEFVKTRVIPNLKSKASLEEYKKKRIFEGPSKTPEPKPEFSADKIEGQGVIQKHKAKKAGLHYDWRFGKDEVLKSFVTRRIPEIDEKTLAIKTEDHPADYINFEGEIPEGYGAGTVEIYEKFKFDIKEWSDNKIKLVIKDNPSLKGEYTFIKLEKNHWLVIRSKIKHEDKDKFKQKK